MEPDVERALSITLFAKKNGIQALTETRRIVLVIFDLYIKMFETIELPFLRFDFFLVIKVSIQFSLSGLKCMLYYSG